MDAELIAQIFEICLIPLLGIITRYIVKFINAKAKEVEAKADNEIEKKYIKKIADTIQSCVETTNQTYVDTLKKEGKFDAEAQEKAFYKTLNAVLATLGEDVKTYITETAGDLTIYLTQRIESTVKAVK